MPSIRRPKDDQNFWNFLFSLFFLAVLLGAGWYMQVTRGGFLVSVPPFDALMLALAAFRLTRLVVYDKIARWFRELFVSKKEVHENGMAYVELVPYGRGIRRTLYDLLKCPWCIGVWSSLFVIFMYFVYPWGWFLDFFLAIASAGSLLQIFANWLGWSAEDAKLHALATERQSEI